MVPIVLSMIVAWAWTQSPPAPELAITRTWVDRVLAHRPGSVDQPLIDIATESPENLDNVRRRIREVLKNDPPARRNDVLRRGALAHTDIALLMPEQAASYVQSGEGREQAFFDQFETPKTLYRRDADRVVFSRDGEFVELGVETAHWSMARGLLRGVTPHAGSDDFVRSWYRAVAAFFCDGFLLGNARYHLERALEVLPQDPVILLYAGAFHEAMASPRVQSVPATRPALASTLRFPSPESELRAAERLFESAAKGNAQTEARLRLARVRGRLGKHDEALALLRDVAPALTDRRLSYLGALFLGTEEAAAGHLARARDAFERAAALFPAAQSPLVALAALARSSGDRAAALGALKRIQALPAEAEARDDPWVDYNRSFAADAPAQLDAVRAWFSRGEGRR